MRLLTKRDWMNNPTKNEIVVTEEVSQLVISGGPMEELGDNIEDLALEIKDTQPEMALQVKATSESLFLYNRFIRDMDHWFLDEQLYTAFNVDGQENNLSIMPEFTNLVKHSGGGRSSR
ncbi:uncharacterized protein FTJAE_9281 [Fusarium tjaetaba]|uniref:Uncharacterized protein n=1 Tax=Fusarium tjaetaba TaxID=1567544 RepID=A0A8H5R3B7_9HYPO|nr:uncharacterized protein FTJAE_9281 [Fusarium tjaetaba]KAF5627326.1 hypothetical protein FTJAE_9281 [Fusarium tjaetaba]